jgi:cysteine synthase A
LVGGATVILVQKVFESLKQRSRDNGKSGFEQLVGNTPLVKLQSLSRLLDCEVYGKAEFLNPGGSVKDRVALAIINSLPSGAVIYEGTSGSTGISLTMAAKAKGHEAVIFLPDDVAQEKKDLLRSLGANLEQVRPMSIVDPNHMCKAAERGAKNDPKGVYANQFENKLNFKAHFEGTAVEILKQTNNRVNVFVGSAGTGGTVAGVASRLKLTLGKEQVKCILADPQGSALSSRVNQGTLFNVKDKEGHRVRHPFDTVTEGVGLNRLTENFKIGIPFIDRAFEVSDLEAVKMSRYLLLTEGLFLGSTSALNCAAIVKARKAGLIRKGDVVVTILCDAGTRHVSKFWNDDYLDKLGLKVSTDASAYPLEYL